MNESQYFEISGNEIVIEIFRKRVTMYHNSVKKIFSCYDIILIIKLLTDCYNEEFALKVSEWIYDNCEYIEKSGRRKCDCWLENDMCFCSDTPSESNIKIEKINESEKWSLF